jgi:hypothetical protein
MIHIGGRLDREAKGLSIEMMQSKKHVAVSAFIPAPRSPFELAWLPTSGPATGAEAADAARGDSKAGVEAAKLAKEGRESRFLRALSDLLGAQDGVDLARKFVECLYVFGADHDPDCHGAPDPLALCVDVTRVDAQSGAAILRLMDTSAAFAKLFHAFARDSGFKPRFAHRVCWLNAPVGEVAPWPDNTEMRCVTSVSSKLSGKLVSLVEKHCAQLDPEKFAEITPATPPEKAAGIKAGIRAGIVTQVAHQLAEGVGLFMREGLSCIDFRSCYHFLVRKRGWEAAFELINHLERDPDIEQALVKHGSRLNGWNENVRVIMPLRPIVRDSVALQLARRDFLNEGTSILQAPMEEGKKATVSNPEDAARLAEACWDMLVVSGSDAFIDCARLSERDQRLMDPILQRLIDTIVKRAFKAGVTVKFQQRYCGPAPLSWRDLARSQEMPTPPKSAIRAMACVIHPENPRDRAVRKSAVQVLTQCVRSMGNRVALIDLTRFKAPQFMLDRDERIFDGDAMCDMAQSCLDEVRIQYELLPIDPRLFEAPKTGPASEPPEGQEPRQLLDHKEAGQASSGS